LFWDFVLKLTRCHAQGGFLRGLRRGSYYRARYYDPQVGGFLSEDPLSLNGDDLNFYRYVVAPSLSTIPWAGSG